MLAPLTAARAGHGPGLFLRAFTFFAVAVAIICLCGPSPALAQAPSGAAATKKEKAQPKNASAPQAQRPQLSLPSAEVTLVMIRATLLSLNDAMATGNFTVLRDLASPSFREANSAGRLYQVFSNLMSQGGGLNAVAILAPTLAQPPAIDANGHLRITGYFPGEPVQINFDLAFEAVNNRWRLFGLAVNADRSRKPGVADASANRAASASK
jgi:hypothetical protein